LSRSSFHSSKVAATAAADARVIHRSYRQDLHESGKIMVQNDESNRKKRKQ